LQILAKCPNEDERDAYMKIMIEDEKSRNMRKIERKQKKNMEGEEMKKEKLIIKVNLKIKNGLIYNLMIKG